MLSATCPSCGKPAPVSLAEPDVLACRACGFSGSTPPEVSRELRAAALALEAAADRDRQLTNVQRTALTSSAPYVVIVALVIVWALLPTLFVAYAMAASSRDPAMWFAFIVAPTAVGAALLLVWFVRRRRALQTACAAQPPRADGEACTCRVCGGSLSAGSTGVVRCAYCRTDNIVAPDVVVRAAKSRVPALAAYEARVRRELTSIGGATIRAAVVGLVGALVMPFVGGMFAILSSLLAAKMVRYAADSRTEYTLVRVGSTDCVARIDRSDEPQMVLHPPGKDVEQRAIGSGPTLHAHDFIGRRVAVIMGDARTGEVRRVFRPLFDDNHAIVHMEALDYDNHFALEDLCLTP